MNKMHADEVDIDLSLVQNLITIQFPEWAALSIEPVVSAGTDNAIYRLGNTMCIRLPRINSAAVQLEKEYQWLPHLVPHLPLAVPMPLAIGLPCADYPYHWCIYQWLEGVNATIDRLTDPIEAAKSMANFIVELRQVDAREGPRPGKHNFLRGVPLYVRDPETRAAIAKLEGQIDTVMAIAAWEAALRLPQWQSAPVWIHGDLQSGNLLAKDGQLNAVIDFGGLAVGDPACDLQIAWNLFSGESRRALRAAVQVDEATWLRGRAWALSVGLIALPYYQTSNPTLAEISRFAINEVLADFASGS